MCRTQRYETFSSAPISIWWIQNSSKSLISQSQKKPGNEPSSAVVRKHRAYQCFTEETRKWAFFRRISVPDELDTGCGVRRIFFTIECSIIISNKIFGLLYEQHWWSAVMCSKYPRHNRDGASELTISHFQQATSNKNNSPSISVLCIMTGDVLWVSAS